MPLITEDLKKFSNRFGKDFWHAINQQYFDSLEPQTTETILKRVHASLQRGTYYPNKPVYYIDKDKGHGVLRRIPVFEAKDYAVYFYCLSLLEDRIAMNRVANTYGGWSLLGLIKSSEEEQLKPLVGAYEVVDVDEYSIPSFSYNKYAWVDYFKDYQRKLYATLKDFVKKPQHMKYVTVQFDIANFYDCIRLNVLEKNLRAVCGKEEIVVIDLLCHFLQYWNRDINGYDSQQTGIPQDAFADCSRILANFYLQDYDKAISDYCNEISATYFRYADDQIIIAENLEEAQAALHKASLELSKIGLNINKSKVHYRSVEELIEHFSFKEFALVHERGNESEVLESVAKKYLNSIDLDKKYSLLNKILGKDIGILRQDLRTRLIADAYEEDFITCYSRSWTLKRIYKRLRKDEQEDFLNYIDQLATANEFTSFHFEVLAFYREIKRDTDGLIDRIKQLQSEWS